MTSVASSTPPLASPDPKHLTKNHHTMKIGHIAAAAAFFALFTQTVLAGEGTPKEQVAKLYISISAGKTEEGFSQLFAASLMAKQKEMQVKAMGTQAKGAFDFYGPPTAIEFIEEKTLSESFMKLKWITKHKDESPLFWSALFYMRANQWEPLQIVFYDDPAKVGL